MEKETRGNVISVRLDDLALEAVDLLVHSGLAQSRSEAAAHLISLGVRSAGDLMLQARRLAEQVQKVRDEMFEAVRARDVNRVKELLDRDASLLNRTSQSGESAVLTSVYYGAREVTDLLLARGAALGLFEAAALGDLARLNEILTDDPSLLQAYSQDGWTPLHLTAFFGHADAAAYLLGRGADIQAISRNQMANLPLHAALAGRRWETARLLIRAGSPLHVTDSAGFTPLHHAAYNGSAELTALILAAGADANARAAKGQTPLTMALERGHGAVADQLSAAGGTA